MHDTHSYLTDYNREYGTCEWTEAELIIYTADDSPHVITEKLGITPSRFSTPSRTQLTKNVWTIASAGFVESRDARHHIDYLLEIIHPLRSHFVDLMKRPGYKACLKCIWFSSVGHGGPAIWPEQMQKLVDLDLELNFAVLFMPED